MAFGQGYLLRVFSRENNSDRDVAPDVLARARAEADAAPVDPFLLKPTGSEKEQRERQNKGVLTDMRAEKKKEREDGLANEWFVRVVMGRVTPAQWDMQMTIVGGAQMTNAEALKFRKWMFVNFDDIYEQQKAKGGFKNVSREEAKDLLKTKIELEEKKRNNEFTEEDEKKQEELENKPGFKDLLEIERDVLPNYINRKAADSAKNDRADNDTQPGSNSDPQKEPPPENDKAILLSSEFADVAGDFSAEPTPANHDILDKKQSVPAIPSGPT